MASDDGVLVVLHNNASALSEALASSDVPGAVEALQKYGDLVRSVLLDLCGYREFKHVEFLELPTSYKAGDVSSPLAVAVGPPLKDDAGQLLGVSDATSVLDIYGALTAQQELPLELADKVGLDEDGVLGFSDTEAAATAKKFNGRLKLDTRFPAALTEEDEDSLAEGLGQQVPDGTELAPLHPEDVLNILSVFLAEAAGGPVSKPSGPGLLQQGRALVGRTVKLPGTVLRLLGKRTSAVTHNLWRLEDFAVRAGKVAIKVAHKAVRPIIVGYILHRALSTIDDSRALDVRMAKLPPSQALDLYYREVLGEDYDKQIEQDLLDAVKEVEEALNTEDYKDEKRLLTAAMLRRLEVEEWDKERMKHFYLGSYGLGPWYFDMEERLHNPYFIGARAWNGPVEGWVGKNKVYHGDMPVRANDKLAHIDAIERHFGKRLTYNQRLRLLEAERVRPVDTLTGPGGLLEGVVDRTAVEQHLAVTQ